MTAEIHFNCFTTHLFFQKEAKIKILEGNQNRNFRLKLKPKFWNENKNFRTKPKILEGNQSINSGRKAKILERNQKFGRKPKISEGNQKFWKENKIKFWRETKKVGKEILTPPGHRNCCCNFLFELPIPEIFLICFFNVHC